MQAHVLLCLYLAYYYTCTPYLLYTYYGTDRGAQRIVHRLSRAPLVLEHLTHATAGCSHGVNDHPVY